jgi:tRNA A-37 threonylcarbamoyl transferase component Bud32
MLPEREILPEHEERLLDTVLAYLEEVDAGLPPDPAAVLARHPDLRDELTTFFADEDRVVGLLRPLRGGGQESLATTEEPGDGRETTGTYQPPEGEEGDDTAGAGAPLPSVPGYEVLGVLGQGGMGVVYKARQVALNRLTALKMIRSKRLADESARARFRAEARAVAQLDHPNLVRVYEYGEAAGQPYLALELVSGGSLAERCKDGPQPPRAAAALTAQLADAVEYAHRRGIVHRDLKPANVLLVSGGVVSSEGSEAGAVTTHHSPLTTQQPKITDFGLAKDGGAGAADLTQPGVRVGTPAYMSPEQADGRTDAGGPAADVFGLGGILYNLLTGRPPFQGDTVAEVLEQARQGQVLPPRQLNRRVPRALERICLKALAADPRQRYRSAAALRDDLRRYLRRPRRLALAAGAVAVLLLAGLCIWQLRKDAGSPAPPLSGELIVRLWSPDGQRKRALRVDELGALPARHKELVVAEARLNQRGYVYLLWLDGQGRATPLYPWNDLLIEHDLTARPPERPPQQIVTSPMGSPDDRPKGWPLDDHDGLETVLLLARRTPLPADVDLAGIVGRLPPTPLRDRGEFGVRGFDEGQPVDSLNVGENRGLEKEAAAIDDPLLGLMQRLREHFEVVRAVRFAHQGR